jgi:hypothetical protein
MQSRKVEVVSESEQYFSCSNTSEAQGSNVTCISVDDQARVVPGTKRFTGCSQVHGWASRVAQRSSRLLSDLQGLPQQPIMTGAQRLVSVWIPWAQAHFRHTAPRVTSCQRFLDACSGPIILLFSASHYRIDSTVVSGWIGNRPCKL